MIDRGQHWLLLASMVALKCPGTVTCNSINLHSMILRRYFHIIFCNISHFDENHRMNFLRRKVSLLMQQVPN